MIEDLTYLEDYVQALDQKQWAYFFMRGAEGCNNVRSKSPVYKKSRDAQEWYRLGYEYMQNTGIRPGSVHDGIFNHTFLSGKQPRDSTITNYEFYSKKIGYEARLFFEVLQGNTTVNEKGTTEMQDTPTLYKVIGEETYGTKLTINSERHIVLEIKGTGGSVAAYPPEKLEEVVTFTIQVTGGFVEGCFLADKDAHAPGDIILVSDNGFPSLVEVKAVNTKSKKAGEFSKIFVKKIAPSKDKATEIPT